MSNNSNSSSSPRVLVLLGVFFVILKLFNIITWSWWYITMPFLIGLLLVIIALIFIYFEYLHKK